MVVPSPLVLVLPCFYRILCERGIEIIRVGRSYDCKVYRRQKRAVRGSLILLLFMSVLAASLAGSVSARSKTVTSVKPLLRRWYAVERPKHPAPMMIIGLPGSTLVIDKIAKALPLFVLHREAKQT